MERSSKEKTIDLDKTEKLVSLLDELIDGLLTLNDTLIIFEQGSNEKVYPISGGEEGQFVFLTEELFDYISTTFYQGKDFRKWEIPYPLEKWKEVSGLK